VTTARVRRTPDPRTLRTPDGVMIAASELPLGDGRWVLVLTVVAGVLRAFTLGSNSLWVDEYATLKIVSLPLPDILRAAAEVNFCPPLYFWAVHGVVSAIGVSEASLRLVSLLAGTLTIPIVWLLTRELTGSRSASVLAAALLALNPLHIWYSQEARAYAFLVCLGAGALLFLLLAIRRNTLVHWVGFIACMAGVLVTHTIGPVFLAVAWSWVFLARRGPRLYLRMLLATAIVALIALPFAMEVAGAVSQAKGAHSPPRPLTGLELPYTLLTYLVGYSFGPSTREIQNLGPWVAIARHPLESLLGGAAVVGIICVMLLRPVRGRTYFLALFLLPIVAMFLASATSGKAYQARYALAGLVGFCGLAAGGLSLLPSRFRSRAVAALVTLTLWADGQWYFDAEYGKDDSRAVVGWLTNRLPAGTTVGVAPPYVTGVLSHYSRLLGADLSFVPADSLTLPMRPEALLLTRLHHVWDEGAVRRSFARIAGPDLSEQSVGGYKILWRAAARGANAGDQR
jgi:mannosyltransferase